MELFTERLIIRPVSKDDGAFIFELMNTEDWKKYIGDRNIQTLQDALDYISEKMLPQYYDIGYGNCVIYNKKTSEKLGSVGLYRRPGLPGTDIGFAMLPKHYKKGYCYEASLRLLKYAKEVLKLDPIQAITNEQNIASQTLIKKLGFTFIDKRKIESIDEEQLYYKFL